MKTIITPDSSRKLNLRELLHYKDLLIILAFRDLKVRYAQTVLGLVWSFIQPLVTLLIFTLVFGRGINIDTGDIPYTVYALTGMSAWTYFSFVMSQSGNSIIGAGDMIKKIYFPRLIIPISKSLVAIIDFLVTFSLLIGFMVYYQIPIQINLLALPVVFFFNVMAALGVGIWLSALTIRYRDFQHIVPFLVQIGLYATPIAYPAHLVGQEYQLIYHVINPMVGIIEGFRWAILGEGYFTIMMGISFIVFFLLFITGIYYFKRMEHTMADLV